jgi:hypothetical protein
VGEWNSGEFSGENGEWVGGKLDSSVVRLLNV